MAGKEKVQVIEIPAKVNVIAEYPVGVLSKAPRAENVVSSPAG